MKWLKLFIVFSVFAFVGYKLIINARSPERKRILEIRKECSNIFKGLSFRGKVLNVKQVDHGSCEMDFQLDTLVGDYKECSFISYDGNVFHMDLFIGDMYSISDKGIIKSDGTVVKYEGDQYFTWIINKEEFLYYPFKPTFKNGNTVEW